jgi:hypothetical protein
MRPPARGRARRHAPRLAVAVGLLGLLAACSSGTEPFAPTTPPTPSPTPTSVGTWPLTGEPAPAASATPVLVVKVDNTEAGRPQLGLAAADLVVEEPVEGGLTRLAVMVQSRLPAPGSPAAESLVVGPVRSVRTSDVGIVSPTTGVLVASGGADPALGALQAAGVRLALEGSPGFSREPSRRAPYNLVVDLTALAAGYPPEPLAPAYLARGDADDLPAGTAASTLTLTFSGAATTTLRGTGDGWVREGDEAGGFVAGSVLALTVPLGDAGYLDPAGNPVPAVATTGTGEGVLAHAGQVWPLRWSKATPSGTAVGVPPGTVYLALLPASSGSISADGEQPGREYTR